MKMRWLVGLASLALVGSAAAQTDKAPAHNPPVWSRLERFNSEAEFMRYVRQFQTINGRRYGGSGFATPDLAMPMPPPPPPPPPPGASQTAAPPAQVASPVVVTGSVSRGVADSAAEPSSITNVQTRGVDEGGIVKMVGHFLVMLQDGRLFVADTRPNGQPGMALVGRTNVYTNARADMWYDELLISGNRVLVTGYSYAQHASVITVFTIDDNGRLTRETAYYITSNDYYDVQNYATRLVNGNLVIYTPLDLRNIDVSHAMRWPVIRRWLRDDARQEAVTTRGVPLFDANDIYKPVQRTDAPFVHSVSVCPLGDLHSGDELDCHTTAFVGPHDREFFVSTSDIFLWVTEDSDFVCTPDNRVPAATIFRVPLDGGQPRALHARGQPSTQMALDASATEFRALVSWDSIACQHGGAPEVRYFHAPLDSFSVTPQAAPARAFVEEPRPDGAQYEVRFTDNHVLYGARQSYSSYPPERIDEPLTARVVAVPVARPSSPTIINAPHNILRIERAGSRAIITGYRTDAGLNVSLIDLGSRPRLVDTRLLQGRYETEGRSQAFNALVGQDDNGLMGLPTTIRVKQSGRWWFRSDASDVSYLGVSADGHLAPAGELLATQNAVDPAYHCEVSCVDWYGNTRALFIGNRVFALSGTELIEGAMVNGHIADRGRLNLSQAPQMRTASN